MFALLLLVVHIFTINGQGPQHVPALFSEKTGRILVPVDVNGHRLWFHLDSGANGIFIDAGAAHAAGLSEGENHTTQPADISVGAVEAKAAWMRLLPDYGYEDDGVHVSGLIGTPFLRSNIVQIDYAKHTVTVIARSEFNPEAIGIPPTKIDYDNGDVRVPVRFGDRWGMMLFDTGAYRSLVFPSFARPIEIGAPRVPAMVSIGYGMPRTLVREILTQPMLIGSTLIQHPDLLEAFDQKTLPEDHFDGILGRDVLQAFRITIDYDDDAIYFEVPQ